MHLLLKGNIKTMMSAKFNIRICIENHLNSFFQELDANFSNVLGSLGLRQREFFFYNYVKKKIENK